MAAVLPLANLNDGHFSSALSLNNEKAKNSTQGYLGVVHVHYMQVFMGYSTRWIHYLFGAPINRTYSDLNSQSYDTYTAVSFD